MCLFLSGINQVIAKSPSSHRTHESIAPQLGHNHLCIFCMAALRKQRVVQVQHCPYFILNNSEQHFTRKPSQMTYATLPHPTTRFGASLSDLIARLIKNVAQRRAFNRTVRELSGLSGPQLEDLGLHRGMIHSVAMDVTYGTHR